MAADPTTRCGTRPGTYSFELQYAANTGPTPNTGREPRADGGVRAFVGRSVLAASVTVLGIGLAGCGDK